jgi:hypothetical protein
VYGQYTSERTAKNGVEFSKRGGRTNVLEEK